MALDEELAAELADIEMPPFTQRQSEWSPEAELLASAVELLQVLISAHRQNPDPIVRWPRPVPAIAAVRESRKWERHRELVDRLTS